MPRRIVRPTILAVLMAAAMATRTPIAYAECLISTVPGPVSNVASLPSCSSIHLWWFAPTSGGPVESYRITRDGSSETLTAQTSEITVTGLNPNTTYTFHIVARNCKGDGQVVNYSRETVGGCPNTPSLQSASQGTSQSVNLLFNYTNGSIPAQSFRIYQRFYQEPNTESLNGTSGACTGTCGVFTGSDPYQMEFSMSAIATVGGQTVESGRSSWVTGWPSGTPIPPNPPTYLDPQGSLAWGSPIRLRWAPVPNARKFNVQVSTNPTFTPPLLFTANSVSTSEDIYQSMYYCEASGLPASQTLYWRVQPISGLNLAGAWSSYRTLTLQPPVITAPSGGSSIAPGSQVTVQWTGANPMDIKLFPDWTVVADSLQGVAVIVDPAATGNQKTFTLPANLWSTNARLQLTQRGADNKLLHVYQTTSMNIVPSTASNLSHPTVATSVPGGQSELTLGQYQTDAHAAYTDGAGSLKHAYGQYRLGSWSTTTLSEPGVYPSVVRDYSQTLHLAYFDTATPNQALRHRTLANGVWSAPVTVAAVGTVEGNCSIATGGTSDVAVAFSGGPSGSHHLRVFQLVSGTWSQLGANIPASTPTDITLRAVGGGQYWLSYLDLTGTRVNVYRYNGQQWVAATLPTTTGPYGSIALALDPQQHSPAVAYTIGGTPSGSQTLVYSRWEAGFNTLETIDASTGTIADVALRFRGENPRIAYAKNGVVKMAERAWGGPWSLTAIDVNGVFGGQLSMDVGDADDRWVLYRERITNTLRATRPYIFEAVTDLTALMGKRSAMLTWTTPSDGWIANTPTSFDVRYSANPITEANFEQHLSIPAGTPSPSGGPNCASIYGLTSCQAYYFAVKPRYSEPLSSGVSNVLAEYTLCYGTEYFCSYDEFASRPAGSEDLPHALELQLKGPNPSTDVVDLLYSVPADLAGGRLRADVHDVLGRHVRRLADEPGAAGRFALRWDLADDDGRRVPGGMYYLRLVVGSRATQRSVLVLRH